MICPKCSREMGSDADVCPYCGFTFLTPKDSGAIHSIPYYSTTSTAQPRENSMPPPPAQTIQATRPSVYVPYAERIPEEPISTPGYIGMLLLSLIPVVGFIVFIVWAAGRNGNPNRKHFAAAMLILKLIFLLFVLGAVIVYLVYTTPLYFYFFR